MKKLYPVILALLASLGVYAQAPSPYPILVDSQRDTVAALQVFQANAITFRASFRSGGTANSIATETPFMYWQPFGATNATVVTAQWSIVSSPSGVVDFAFTPASLNYAAGTYTYQVGLEQSGGPLVIKQGTFKINPSAASIGAEPIVFSSTNINWGSINWSGVPDWDLITNVNAKLTTLSNNLQTAINNVDSGATWSQASAVADPDFAQYYATNMGGIDFDLSPSGAVQPARIQWDSNIETLRLGLDAAVSLDVGQQQVALVRNAESVTISNGMVVYISGATGDKASVKIASYSNDTLSARTIGIAAENITAGSLGFVVTRGPVYHQNTSAFSAGSMLYLGAYGNVSTNRPQAPLHGVFIGVVEKVNANAGIIYVAVQNGFELDELHDVNVSGVSSGQVLRFNGTVWTNATIATGGATGTPIYVEADPVWTSEKSGYATGTPLYAYTETDPIWAAASNSYYTAAQIDAAFATGSPIYSLAGYATGTPLYAYTETDPIWSAASNSYYTAAQVDAAFATGTPIYSLAGYATGTPLYAYTETDPVWTAASSSYYTASQADALFATGSPVYSVDLSSYLTSTGAAATYLPLAGGTMAGNINMNEGQITNVSVVGLFSDSNRAIQFEDGTISGDYIANGTWAFDQQPTIPGYLTTSTWASADSTTNYASRITFNATSNAFNTRITATEGYTNRAASALASSVWATADSTTNYTSRVLFNASSNAINARLVAVESYTNRAASALSSSVWASADSTTNYIKRNGTTATEGINISASATDSVNLTLTNNGLSATGLRINMDANSTFFDFNIAGTNNEYTATDTTLNLHGNILTNAGNIFGNAAGLTNFSSQLLLSTVSAFKVKGRIYSDSLSGIHTNPALVVSAENSVYGGFYSIHSGDIIIKPGDGVSSAVPSGGDVFISGGAGHTSPYNGSVIVSNVSSIHFNDGTVISNFASSLSGFANNILTTNLLLGLPESSRTNISAGNVGAIQAGKGWTTNDINITGYSQHGIVENLGPAVGTAKIGFNAHGANQNGWIYGGRATIGDYAYGSMQRGYLRNSNATATLNGAASMQLFYFTNEATAFTTTNAYGSILLGSGTNDVAYSIKAAGGFYGNAAGLTNFPSSLLTVSAGNANYWRITTAPTGATASGSSGQMAVSGTNIYIYSPNALGTGTGRWGRVNLDVSW
jgi:hypothetical protein